MKFLKFLSLILLLFSFPSVIFPQESPPIFEDPSEPAEESDVCSIPFTWDGAG